MITGVVLELLGLLGYLRLFISFRKDARVLRGNWVVRVIYQVIMLLVYNDSYEDYLMKTIGLIVF